MTTAIDTTNVRVYKDGRNIRLIFTGNRFVDGAAYLESQKGFHPITMSGDPGTGTFQMAVPDLNMAGPAIIQMDDSIHWLGWAYKPRPEPFQGALSLAPPDTSPRIGEHFLVGIGDGYVVYVSRTDEATSSGYRAFAERVSTEHGILPRLVITKCTPYRDGSARLETNLGSIDTASPTWRVLPISDYTIEETPTEVRFQKK